MINKDSHIPIYFQLEQEIKNLIEHLKPGDLIGSEREFAEKYNISRMTVRQAINNLVAEGIVVRQRGKGTFVATPKVEHVLSELTSFSEDMQGRGMEPQTKVLGFQIIPCNRNIAKKLHLSEGTLVYEISRLRIADQIPMALETSYLSAVIVKGLEVESTYGSIYEYVEKTLGLKISHATQTIESTLCQSHESSELRIKVGDPVLLMKRYSYLEQDIPFEYTKSVYRGDRYKYVIEMKR